MITGVSPKGYKISKMKTNAEGECLEKTCFVLKETIAFTLFFRDQTSKVSFNFSLIQLPSHVHSFVITQWRIQDLPKGGPAQEWRNSQMWGGGGNKCQQDYLSGAPPSVGAVGAVGAESMTAFPEFLSCMYPALKYGGNSCKQFFSQ